MTGVYRDPPVAQLQLLVSRDGFVRQGPGSVIKRWFRKPPAGVGVEVVSANADTQLVIVRFYWVADPTGSGDMVLHHLCERLEPIRAWWFERHAGLLDAALQSRITIDLGPNDAKINWDGQQVAVVPTKGR